MLLTPLNASLLVLSAILSQGNPSSIASFQAPSQASRQPIPLSSGQNTSQSSSSRSGIGSTSPTQGAGSGSHAQAAATGPILIQTNSPQPPSGQSLKGTVNLSGSQETFDLFQTTGVQGGLYRVNLQMWDDASLNQIGEQMAIAQTAGMRVLLTAYGTPAYLASSGTGVIYEGAMPPYARTVPTNMQSWADDLAGKLLLLQTRFGALPELIEIGNEPDRMESWDGTLADFLSLYETTSKTLSAQFPGLRIGGMGLAGSESDMGTQRSALMGLLDHCDANSLPLDFISWHNYGLGSEIRYTKIVQRLESALQNSGRSNTELFITEWNILPNTMFHGDYFDNSHGAANLVSFLASSQDLGLDGSCFFMLLDLCKQEQILDLTGKAMGAITSRGIKKPVYRAMEFVLDGAMDVSLPVQLPENEFAVGVLATQNGPLTQLIISNDSVSPDWVFAKSCREFGLEPGVMAVLLDSVGASPENPPLIQQLLQAGLSQEEAISLMTVLNRSLEAERLRTEARTIEIQLDGMTNPWVNGVWRFDDTHNSPLNERPNLLPFLEIVEQQAQASALQCADNYLVSLNNELPPDLPAWRTPPEELSLELGISIQEARQLRHLIRDTLRSERLKNISFFDTLPGSSLAMETANEAGVTIVGNTLHLELQPNSVLVLEVEQ